MKNLIFICLIVILNISCATIQGTDQRVKLTSSPEGAGVYEGDELLGKTPGFFYVDRAYFKTLTLKKRGYEDSELSLSKSYRWKESFFANLIWLYMAPVGWGVDLLTGSALDYDKIEEFPRLDKKDHSIPDETHHPVIVIAPPKSDHEIFSAEVGEKLYLRLKKRFPEAKLVPFRETELRFATYSYTNKDRVEEAFADDLYETLGATYIAQADVEGDEGDIKVKVGLKNIFTEKTEKTFTEKFSENEFRSLKMGGAYKWLTYPLSFIPNSIAFDFVYDTNEYAFEASDATHHYKWKRDDSNPYVKYVSGLTLRNIVNTRVRPRIDLVLTFSPRYDLIYSKIKYTRLGGGELHDSTLTRMGLSAGLGPELGLEFPLGYIYLRVSGDLIVENIDVKRGDGVSSSETGYGFQPAMETGYSFFMTKNLNIHLYGRGTYNTRDTLKDALQGASSHNIKSTDSFTSRFGFSLGYFFPEGKSYLKRLFY